MAKREKYEFTSSFLTTYKEVEQIGEGGNSTVYKVIDEQGNYYALKLLNKKINTESTKRFKNEIGYCMRNTHPNILKVIDNGVYETNGEKLMFYVMPLYSKNLRELMREKLDDNTKLEYFNQILEGVKHIHNGKSYHRDIKPENILFDEKKELLVVSDFGISHFNQEELDTIIETKLHSRMANFQYSAPEQKEKGGVVDHRADIYALGLILNEFYTGKVPIGTGYRKIADVSPEYSFLDDIIDMMIKQNKEERPTDIISIQQEINIRLKIYNESKEIKRLQEIEIKDEEENDILILQPPKLINVTYDEEEGRLRFQLSIPVNQLWIDSITTNSWSSVMGYGPEKFHFEREYASVQLPVHSLNSAQNIVNYFKQWIDNANRTYPVKIRQERENKKLEEESKIKAEIQRKEKIVSVMKNIKI